ncbi:MAG TPA: molybdenum cofactor biosynthesis protein B [Alphaproteobacteria bacterium]|nr:molybdenum cofactor biosynthesis protein B [Alphaproteobacteria bacterium]
MAGIDPKREFKPIRIAVLTMSDSRSLADDKSGDYLAKAISEAGHLLADRALVKDDIWQIRARICQWVADGVDVVLTTGGTGLTGRDVTIEAVAPLLDKQVDGFAVLFHQASIEMVATSTMQSRAMGGLAGSSYIFCLPGSTGACRDAWEKILQFQLDHRHRPCNLVEIMPRLQENEPQK